MKAILLSFVFISLGALARRLYREPQVLAADRLGTCEGAVELFFQLAVPIEIIHPAFVQIVRRE
jgi:hypothetical protein